MKCSILVDGALHRGAQLRLEGDTAKVAFIFSPRQLPRPVAGECAGAGSPPHGHRLLSLCYYRTFVRLCKAFSLLTNRKFVVYSNHQLNHLSSRRGETPHRRLQSATCFSAADLVRFQNRQYSLDERRNCVTWSLWPRTYFIGPGLFYLRGQRAGGSQSPVLPENSIGCSNSSVHGQAFTVRPGS